MVRNAGGRAFDAIRTLAALQTIGAPGTIVVMHHTGKGSLVATEGYEMLTFFETAECLISTIRRLRKP